MARGATDVTRRIVTVRNSHGHALHCMLEEPVGGAAGARFAAVLLCPGIKTRTGPHRLYRKLAQSFLARGIPVMRVDFHGLGDSEGELPETRLDEMYDQVQMGRHVDDLKAALDWLEAECRIQRYIVGGLCGAAITALVASHKDPRIAGLYAIGLPVALGASKVSVAHMTHGELLSERVSYLRKLFRPGSWLRLLMLRSNYRLIWRMMTAALRSDAGRQRMTARLADVPPPASPPSADLNPSFPPAFFGLLISGRPALLIFGERDRLRVHYAEKFVAPWIHALEPYKAQISLEVIPDANHILGEPKAVADACRATAAWLDANFLAGNAAAMARGMTRLGAVASRIRVPAAARSA
jgi:hypothetical protein